MLKGGHENSNAHFFALRSRDYWKSLPGKCFPIVTWLPYYSIEDFKGDLIAGLTVGLTVVPQGLALAHLAELPPQYGLYTAFMGSFMYAVFGTCKDVVIGPTSVMALMTADHVLTGGPSYAVVLSFICGCFQLLFGILNLGFLVNFISAAVLSGFTSAAAIIIASSQLKGLLGLKFQSYGFLENLYQVCNNISKTNLYDLLMGSLAILFLLLLKEYKDKKCRGCLESLPRLQHFLHVLWWSFATARNLIIVLLCSVIAAGALATGNHAFTLTQHVDAGLPPFALPPLSFAVQNEVTNTTEYHSTLYILKDLGSGTLIVPLLSLLEAIAIAKVFSRSKKLDATKEMIALGMGNLMGSFVSAYPVTASFSRTVINNNTGVRTPLGGIFSGLLVLLALGVIAPSFHYIPKACLSAIVFSAVIFMIHYQDIPAMWKMGRSDLIPFSVTFFLSLTLGLEYGLLFGVAVSLGMLLFKQNKTKIHVKKVKDENGKVHIHITPSNCIYFPAIESLKGKITSAVHDVEGDCRIIIHGDRLTGIDYATAMGIKSVAQSLKQRNISIDFYISEPSALVALSCLAEYVKISKPHEDIQDLIAGNLVHDGCENDAQGEIHESDSTVALLATAKLECSIDMDGDSPVVEKQNHVGSKQEKTAIV